MNKLLVVFLLVFFFAFVATYLCGAYASLELDPRNWSLTARSMQVYVASAVAGAVTLLRGLQ